MSDIRSVVRPALFLAALALLASSACVPPITFHDGLPAWTPEQGRTEGSVGYHRMFWFYDGGGGNSVGYLTPGVRFGLARPLLAAEVGLTSVVVASEGTFGAGLGPMLGLGYQSPGFNFVARPSMFVLGISKEGVQFNLSDTYWQVSLLAGNGYRAGRTHVSGGGRISDYGIGPVFLVGGSLGAVDVRAEASLMFPNSSGTAGQLLTVGLTVAGPAPSQRESGTVGLLKKS